MRTDIEISELPARLDEAVALAAAGQDVVLVTNGTPRAKLLPLLPLQERVLGLHPGAFQLAPDFDDPLPDEFWMGKE